MNSTRTRLIWRIILAGPLVFITAIITMMGTAVWFPKGAADVDNIVLPLVLFPLIWSALFFYASLVARLRHAYLMIFGILFANIALVALQVLVLSKLQDDTLIRSGMALIILITLVAGMVWQWRFQRVVK